ncbi:MAG TPA: VTT domain-containing protein [Dissulfurispiraceae bacterium]|nr:VTT domain-containing protein [Dissulfurispiraceae bacterium]
MSDLHKHSRHCPVKPRGSREHIWINLFAFLFISALLIWLMYETDMIQLFTNRVYLERFLSRLNPMATIAVFILLQSLQVVFAPIPGEVTGLVGGILFGEFWGVVWSTAGLTLGSYIAFALTRRFGQPFVERFVSQALVAKFDYLLHHKGAFMIFLLFLIPGVPKDALCYILGLGHLTTTEFLLIGGTGRLFGTILLTLGGTYIRHEQYEKFWVLTAVAIVVVLLAMLMRERIERLLRILHIRDYKKRKAKRTM